MNNHRDPIRWADWLLAAATVLLAALLIGQCLAIYSAGTSPDNFNAAGVKINAIYTREGVALRLSRIAWAFWLWAAALAAAVICRRLRPLTRKALPPSPETRLWLIAARREPTPAMEKEERFRRLAGWLCAAACVLCAGFSAWYLLDRRHFTSTDLETVMAAMAVRVFPLVLLGLAALMALAQARYRSVLREIAAAQAAPPRPAEKPIEGRRPWRPGLRAALYLAALALLVAGILNGGMYDVLVKAVNICTECIGLG